jgi:hypothetical protein
MRTWRLGGGQAVNEKPRYSEISEEEMRDLEADFGRPLTRDLAFWFIRMRTNRTAILRMIGEVEDEEWPEEHSTEHERVSVLAAAR